MTAVDEPAGAPAPEPASSAAGQPDRTAPPQQPAGDRRVHQYDAASTRRDEVLSAFESQRTALLKAVDEQRQAAMAPIRAVQARRLAQLAGEAAPNAFAQPAVGTPALAGGAIGGRIAAPADHRRVVATEIATALKMMVAAEVRAQLEAILREAVPHRDAHATPSEPYASVQHENEAQAAADAPEAPRRA